MSFVRKKKCCAGVAPFTRDSKVLRTPDVLEAEFVTTITITTLLMTAALSLAGAINPDDLDVYCADECITRAGIFVNLYLSTWTSGAGFFVAFMFFSFILYVAYKMEGILPTDIDVANTFFQRFQNEIAASYIFAVLSMMFLFCSMTFYYSYVYEGDFVTVSNFFGLLFVLFIFPYMCYTYKYGFKKDMLENDRLSGSTEMFKYLEVIECSRYTGRFTAARITLDEFKTINVGEMVDYLTIPLGDAKKMYDHFQTNDPAKKRSKSENPVFQIGWGS